MTLTAKADVLDPKYLFAVLSNNTLPKRGTGQPFIAKGDVVPYEIPLPPLEEQRRIVAEIEGYQQVIDGARQIFAGYRQVVEIYPEWPLLNLCDVTTFQEGPGMAKDFRADGIPIVRLAGLRSGIVSLAGCNYFDPQLVKKMVSFSSRRR